MTKMCGHAEHLGRGRAACAGPGPRFYLCVQQQWLKQLHLPWLCREKWISGSEGALPLFPGLVTHTGPVLGIAGQAGDIVGYCISLLYPHVQERIWATM